MNISKQSWHYKLIASFCTFPPEDFCAYCRSLVLSISITLILATVMLLVFPLVVGILFNDLFTLLSLKHIDTEDFNIITYLLLLVSGYVLITIISPIVYFSIKYFTIFKNKLISKVKYKEDSILTEWIKHKKGKYCSRVTFKD